MQLITLINQKMINKKIKNKLVIFGVLLMVSACMPKSLIQVTKTENKAVPASYVVSQDSTNTAKMNWKNYFTDSNLTALIDTALHNNQELNITLQEIEIAKNEIRARKGEYLPFVTLGGGAGVEKV